MYCENGNQLFHGRLLMVERVDRMVSPTQSSNNNALLLEYESKMGNMFASTATPHVSKPSARALDAGHIPVW